MDSKLGMDFLLVNECSINKTNLLYINTIVKFNNKIYPIEERGRFAVEIDGRSEVVL